MATTTVKQTGSDSDRSSQAQTQHSEQSSEQTVTPGKQTNTSLDGGSEAKQFDIQALDVTFTIERIHPGAPCP